MRDNAWAPGGRRPDRPRSLAHTGRLPAHFGYSEHPQNFSPALAPRRAVRRFTADPQRGHASAPDSPPGDAVGWVLIVTARPTSRRLLPARVAARFTAPIRPATITVPAAQGMHNPLPKGDSTIDVHQRYPASMQWRASSNQGFEHPSIVTHPGFLSVCHTAGTCVRMGGAVGAVLCAASVADCVSRQSFG